MAPTGIGDADTKPQTCKADAGGEMPEYRPRFELSVDLRHEFGDTDVARCRDRPWEQRVQVIGYPVGVDTAGPGGQHIRASQRGRGIAGIDDLISEADSKLVHTQRLSERCKR